MHNAVFAQSFEATDDCDQTSRSLLLVRGVSGSLCAHGSPARAAYVTSCRLWHRDRVTPLIDEVPVEVDISIKFRKTSLRTERVCLRFSLS